jgi:hypothetical protein
VAALTTHVFALNIVLAALASVRWNSLVADVVLLAAGAGAVASMLYRFSQRKVGAASRRI